MIPAAYGGIAAAAAAMEGAKFLGRYFGRHKFPTTTAGQPLRTRVMLPGQGRRRRYKKGKFPYRLGKRHCQVFTFPGSTLSSAQLYAQQDLKAISLNDLYDGRQSNNILSRKIIINYSANNNHTVPRMWRFLVLQLRGSQSSADTTNWTDLLINATYTKSGPTGLAENMMYRVNGDEYKVVSDIKFKLGTSGDVGSSVLKTFKIKTNKIIKYAYNSTDVRQGPLYLVWLYTEAEGQGTNAATIDYTMDIRHYYVDLD